MKTETQGSVREVDLDLEGMTCASCAARIEKVLRRQPGVAEAQVNFAAERAHVVTGPEVPVSSLLSAVERAGYSARPHTAGAAGPAGAGPAGKWLRRFILGAVLTAPAMVLGMALPDQRWAMYAGWALVTPVQMIAGWPFMRTAARLGRRGEVSMDTLVAIGTLAAYFYSAWATVTDSGDAYFETAGTIITLIALGKYLEASSRGRASAAIRALAERGAKEARVLRDGAEVVVPIASLRPGDRFVVRPGEKVATDGVVREGSSALDESLVTGESVPRERGAGDEVIGGTINTSGRLIVEATRVGADTALAQIARLVEEAQASKAPIQRLADRISSVFVPVILVIAAATFAGWMLAGRSAGDALVPAVAVLIIACPCAMGLATPAAIMVGTARGAQMGILIRGGEALERSRDIDAVVLDKTGTVTEGRMRVTGVVADEWNDGAVSPDEVLRYAAAVESGSEHPIAVAVVNAARERGISVPGLDRFHSDGGLGARGDVEGQTVIVGRPAWLGEQGLMSCTELDQERSRLEATGKTVFAVGWSGRVRGLVAVADSIKPNAPAAVAALKSLGAEVTMLTGDARAPAEAIAHEAGIERVVAEVLPAGKVDVVRELQHAGQRVAVAGDGVNDAPALAQAELGIAVGSGADVAIEAADITLVGDDLLGVPSAIRLARRTYRTIVQNLFWAFVYNVALVPLAAAGKVNPMLAAAAMATSSVSVVSNALRLRRVRPYRREQ